MVRPDFAISHLYRGARFGAAAIEDLIAACRAVDSDIERQGAVSEESVRLVRAALTKVGAQ